MGDLVSKRFFRIMEEEAKKLAEKEGNEINPINIVVDDIDRQYIYSLASLDTVIALASGFHESLSKRKKEQMTKVQREMDEKHGRDNACRIVFYLRGYIKVFSEDSMVLQGRELNTLLNLIVGWLGDGLENDEGQDDLSRFIWNWETEWLKEHDGVTDKQLNKDRALDDLIDTRVIRKLKAIKDTLLISTAIMDDIINNAWSLNTDE